MNDFSSMNIPLLNNILKRQNDFRSSNPTPINDSLSKKNAQFIRDHPELIDKFNEISKELIKMGYSPNLINNMFLVKRFQTLVEAVELLSFNNNLWNHEYVEGDNFICFICEAPENKHVKSKSIFKPQHIDANIIKRMNNARTRSIEKNKLEYVIKMNLKDCPICFAEIKESNKYLLKCKHLFCRDCIINYLEEEINNDRVVQIKCPWKECTEKFQDEEIKFVVNNENLYKKMIKFRLRREIGNDPNKIVCPIADCEGFSKNLNNNLLLTEDFKPNLGRKSLTQVKFTCTNSHNFCGKCNKIWHGNESCEDDKEIVDFATENGKMLKKCLKCKVWTEKNEGCNHMHCKICEFDWCWLCEGACTPDHYKIQNTPCYGRLFNQIDTDFELYEMLIDQNNFFKSLLFLFVFSFFIINSSIRNVLNPVMENNHLPRPSKFVVLVILFCFLTFGLVFLVLTNGIILLYMFLYLGKLQTVRNNFSKIICVTVFLLLLLIFYPFGLVLGCFWFTICMIYSIVKLIQFR